ncbi:MAG: dienelactone hydrolase family protein [Planctomycetota bacterium]
MTRIDEARSLTVRIPAGREAFEGDLALPADPAGMVIFAHGSGSSRFSRRNRKVAEALQAAGFATLLLDLLTPEEEAVDQGTRQFRFDIPRLGRRVVQATDWCRDQDETERLPVGYFGASTGAAAALVAAAERSDVAAVVSRGGRPDLADESLPAVQAPTLLIVGGRDTPVIGMNREAMARMSAEVDLRLVSGATHLFEEAGALAEVTGLAMAWFQRHLSPDAGER